MRNTLVFRLAILTVVAGLSGALGCNTGGIGSAEVPIEEIPSVPAWDAGILLPGSATSVLFPLDVPTIESAEDIVAISSSCDCTTAEAWNYWDDDGRRRVAIRVHMLEKSGPPRKSTAARLGVLLTITTRTGDVIERSVRVLLSREVTTGWDPEFG